jgi:tripeptide aminopeptidase
MSEQASASAPMRPPTEAALDRFLRYAVIDTQSAEGVDRVPSTQKQLDLSRLLVRELEELGAEDVRLDGHGILMARVPGNLPEGAGVPVIGFIAHVDTAPGVSGKDVQPVIHHDYRGGDIVLPADPTAVIEAATTPVLKELIGDDIITADGTTLLGSDDKAGIAEIMTMLDTLRQNPDMPRGPLAIAFTPDEETSTGVHQLDVEAFGATFAYTVDGPGLGEINNETWNARTATITFTGRDSHPGYAKGVMVNTIDAFAHFVTLFPPEQRPHTTEGRAGFLHPMDGGAGIERSTLIIGLRSFEMVGVEAQERTLRDMAEATRSRYPDVGIQIEVAERYRNLGDALEPHPEVVANAVEATRRAGLEPVLKGMRGGTDGSILSFKGLPTPDLFTGGHNWHSVLEFNSRRGLEKSTETLLHLVQVWAESGSKTAG